VRQGLGLFLGLVSSHSSFVARNPFFFPSCGVASHPPSPLARSAAASFSGETAFRFFYPKVLRNGAFIFPFGPDRTSHFASVKRPVLHPFPLAPYRLDSSCTIMSLTFFSDRRLHRPRHSSALLSPENPSVLGPRGPPPSWLSGSLIENSDEQTPPPFPSRPSASSHSLLLEREFLPIP